MIIRILGQDIPKKTICKWEMKTETNGFLQKQMCLYDQDGIIISVKTIKYVL